MAFQMSKLAARVSLSKSVGFIPSAGNRCPSHLNFISRLAHRSFHALCTAGRGSATIKVLPSPGLLRKADRWEKVSTASKSLHRQSGWAVKPNRTTRVVVSVIGVSAAVLASLSTSTLHAMNARPDLNLDSESSDWKEAKSESVPRECTDVRTAGQHTLHWQRNRNKYNLAKEVRKILPPLQFYGSWVTLKDTNLKMTTLSITSYSTTQANI